MTLRIKTLTAVAALTLGAAGAYAQTSQPADDQVIVPAAPVATTDTAVSVDSATEARDQAGEAPETEQPAAEVPTEAAPAETAPAQEAVTTEPEAAPEATPAEAPEATEAASDPEADVEPAAEETPAEEPAAEPAAEEPAAETDAAAMAEPEAAHEEAAAEEHAAASHESHVEDVSFSFEGPFGTYDQFQLQRGLQVFTEVCSACHGMKQVSIRTLGDKGGPELPADQVRAYAAQFDITDRETGEDRPRIPTDKFPTVTGEGMGPDLSLMAKARAAFHGPQGTGVNQFFRGIGGPEYIHAILTGYTGETKEEAGSTFYENTAFPGGWIQMPPPLSDDLVTYEDGTAATLDQQSMDVAAFLMWAAEPKMMDRKQVGFASVLFLILLSALLYLTNKRLWWPIKHRHD